MKYLIAEKQVTQYFFRVHMDETKILDDDSPDPNYIRDFSWCLTPPDDQTETEYLEAIKREIALLVQVELDALTSQPAPTPLPGF